MRRAKGSRPTIAVARSLPDAAGAGAGSHPGSSSGISSSSNSVSSGGSLPVPEDGETLAALSALTSVASVNSSSSDGASAGQPAVGTAAATGIAVSDGKQGVPAAAESSDDTAAAAAADTSAADTSAGVAVGAAATPPPTALRKLWLLAVPLMLNNLAGYALSIVGAVYIGQLGALPLAASVLANSVYNCTGLSLALGLSAGMETLCGQAYGGGAYARVGIVLQRALLVCWTVCLPVVVLWVHSHELLLRLGQQPEVRAEKSSHL